MAHHGTILGRVALAVAVLACNLKAADGTTNLADLVNPMIGTAAEGQTYPAAGVPFAMTQWTPQTRAGEAKCVAPYYQKDTRIQGFRGTHFLSGSCVAEYGSFTIMPVSGKLQPATEARASAFSRDTEHARPYRYDVALADYGIRASITATARAGILRFEFERAGPAWIVLESNAHPGEGEIRIDPDRKEVWGSNPVHRLYAGAGKPAGFSGYFVARFDRAFESNGRWGQAGAWLGFSAAANEKVLVKVGTSFVSFEEARRNLDSEIPGWEFDAVANAAAAEWNRALSRIQVSSAGPRELFYTALYHSMLVPRLFSDADGSYPEFAGGRRAEKASGFAYYCDFTLWDTFRSLHPLLALIDPGRTREMMQSLVAKGRQGGWMPVYPAWNSYTQEMIGDHAVAAIADAYLKGIRGFDIEEAYRLVRKNAVETPESFEDYADGRGRRALESYLKYGYVPLEDPVKDAFHKAEQVSRTLEYAYDDFVISQLADALGKHDDGELFRKRALNYRNVIDPSTGFARGRHADGSWAEPFDATKSYAYITEGLPFQYTFFVPHDIAGLINLLGGHDAFIRKLDALFATGSYNHGNEPSHHIAYLYDYAGAPWKTQERVRQIMHDQYSNGPAGLAGNDDGGQMSAWYVFSALGLYPVAPGIPAYEIGTPAFDSADIVLAGGKRFSIRAPGASVGKFYIQSAKLNAKSLTRPWIKHDEIAAGGELVFNMGARPNPSWGSAPENAPPSMSKPGR